MKKTIKVEKPPNRAKKIHIEIIEPDWKAYIEQ